MPWPIVPAPSTPTHRIGRAEALLFFSCESLLNVLSQKRGRTASWIRIEATVLAGACLVRLTRTLIVILYAQPKTPIDFLLYNMQPRQNREGSDRTIGVRVVVRSGRYRSPF